MSGFNQQDMKDIKADYNKALNEHDNVLQLLGKGYPTEEISRFMSKTIPEIELIAEIHNYDANKFRENEKLLKEMVVEIARKANSENKIICDGVAHPENYYKQDIRIMWILKEAYETKVHYGWQVGKIYKPYQPIKYRTLKLMAYVSHAILNNCDTFNLFKIDYDVSSVFKTKNQDLLESIKSIAYININKIAAKSRSPQDMSSMYKVWHEVLLKQIEIYAPNIIICDNTLQYFSKDIDFAKGIKKPLGIKNHNYYLYDNKIYISIYHPAYPFSKKPYVLNIIDAVIDWKKTNNKFKDWKEMTKNEEKKDINSIITTVEKYYNLQVNAIIGNKRTNEIIDARKIAMFIAHEYYNYSIGEISKIFNKDRGMVLHHISSLETKLELKEQMKIIDEIRNIIN
jgi:DNA-binding CsgD family transcriptional regulator